MRVLNSYDEFYSIVSIRSVHRQIFLRKFQKNFRAFSFFGNCINAMAKAIHDLVAEVQTDSGRTIAFPSVDSGVAFFEDARQVFCTNADAGVFDYECNGRCRGYV